MKVKSESEVTQPCLTLSNLMDCSPPGSSIHGIFQARVLEWGAIAFSNCLSWKVVKMVLFKLESYINGVNTFIKNLFLTHHKVTTSINVFNKLP